MRKTVSLVFALLLVAAAAVYAFEYVGAKVMNTQGEELGEITEVVYDEEAGENTFAILASGGILGIGEKMIPVPISALTIHEDQQNVVLDMTSDELASAPSFDEGSRPDMSDRQWAEETYRFYGQRPPWESGMEEAPMMEEEQPMEQQPMEEEESPAY